MVSFTSGYFTHRTHHRGGWVGPKPHVDILENYNNNSKMENVWYNLINFTLSTTAS